MNATIDVITDVEPATASLRRGKSFLRRHLRLIGIAMLAVLLAFGAGLANNVMVARYTPATAVSAYLTALEQRDAEAARTQVQITQPDPKQSPSLKLLGEDSMKAALDNTAPDFRQFAIDATTYDASQTRATVIVTYETANDSRQTTLTVVRTAMSHYGLYPDWKIELAPTMLSVRLPEATSFQIDGRAISLAVGADTTIAILPTGHRILFGGTEMLLPQTLWLKAFGQASASVAYTPALTEAGVAAATAAVKASLIACANKTSLQPDGCPQAYGDPLINSGRWSLVGDPTTDIAIGFDASTNLAATGHYQMIFAFEDGGTKHRVVAGGYVATLEVQASAITASAISPVGGLAPIARPSAATDEAALSIVAKGLATCAQATGPHAPDCPQDLASPLAENVHWKLSGDPTQSATVTFDSASGIFTVSGPLDMTASYTINGYPSSDRSAYTSYDAQLLWDGAQFQLVTIQGSFS